MKGADQQVNPLIHSKKGTSSRKINKVFDESRCTRIVMRCLQDLQTEFTIEDLAKKTNLSTTQITLWICSVGKQTKEIKKLGVGIYKYETPK